MSRKTFYQQFHNKEEVFADAYDQALGELLDMMRDAAETSQGRRDRLAVRVTTLLTLLARDEAVGRVCFVEVAAGGLSEVIHHEIVAGRGARLVSLAPDMVETVLSPIWAEAGWQ